MKREIVFISKDKDGKCELAKEESIYGRGICKNVEEYAWNPWLIFFPTRYNFL